MVLITVTWVYSFLHRRVTLTIITLIGMTAALVATQMAAPRVTAASIAPPAPGTPYTWNVLASSGDVWWYVVSNEGHRAIEENGTITYQLTGLHPNNVSWTLPGGEIWYGDLGLNYANGSSNWTRANCSNNEAGYALALNAGDWVGGFVAPSNWAQNFADLNGQSGTQVRDIGGMVIIDFENAWQTSHLEYDKATSVLTYAETSVLGFFMEIQLADLAALPSAGFTVNASTLIADFPVQFTDTSYGGVRPFSYTWDFDDGTTSDSQNTFHIYASAGSYDVNLTIVDAAANKSSHVVGIIVQADTAPVADFTVSGSPGVGLALLFNSTSYGGNIGLSYTWNFGDGTAVSHLEHVTHAFSSSGKYTVTLTVRDADGDTDIKTYIVDVPGDSIPGAEPALLALAVLASLGVTSKLVLRKIK